jgi:hypothetical protein
MHERSSLTRREFTVASALAALSGVAITITACGGGSSSSPASPSGPSAPPPTTGGGSGDKVASISANHGHSAVVTAVQLTAAGALSLDIRGQADHPHTVALSADEVRAIAANQRVPKSSTTDDGHSHTVTFN